MLSVGIRLRQEAIKAAMVKCFGAACFFSADPVFCCERRLHTAKSAAGTMDIHTEFLLLLIFSITDLQVAPRCCNREGTSYFQWI